MIREIFLQQNAYHKVDTYCPLNRQYTYMKLIKKFSELANKAVENDVAVDAIVGLPVRNRLAKSKFEDTIDHELEEIAKEMPIQFETLGEKK